MRCAVSFLTIIILSIAVGVMALYIIWITDNGDECQHFRCLEDGKCIKPIDVCNDIRNCPDGSDEALIHCHDFTTTSVMITIMAKCINTMVQIDNTTLVKQKPEECEYLGLKYTPNAIGIKCNGSVMGKTWEQISWNEFDPFSRTISIDTGAINTSRLVGNYDETKNKSPKTTILAQREFQFLNKLYVDHNYIESVGERAFCNMENVCWFSLRDDQIKNLNPDAFCPMMKLKMLKMSENKLTLQGFQFKHMNTLEILDLAYNKITEINSETFSQLANLAMLNISNNFIQTIHERAFQNNVNLIELDLTANQLSYLSPSVFEAQINLTKLYISSNPKLYMPALLFAPLRNLRSLNVESLDISQFDVTGFHYTTSLDLIYFKKFSYCRYVPKAQRCFPHSDGLSSTSNLLIGQSRIMVWLVGLATVVGNLSVVANRWCRKRTTGRTEITEILNIFVTNLAMADFLMGVYLVILACKDVQFRGMYSVKAYEWGTSWLCSFIGIIAVISSEVSLLILTIMSLERYLTIGGPFSRRQNLNTNLARASMGIIWAFSCILALAPAFQWQGEKAAFYGSTGLCFPIHLDDRYPMGWQYTTFVFIGVNSCCLVLITVSYSMLFITVRRTQRKTPLLVKNIELASRFFLMVITDVLCWAPIIILKASVLCGYELSKEIIGWAVIYVLPLNSAVNPILYTFSTNEVRNALKLQISTLIGNFELNQLIPSQNHHANMIELQGITRSWLSRFNPRRNTNVQRNSDPVVRGASEDTELTHSTCPTVITTDAVEAGGVGGIAGKPNLNNSFANASIQTSRSIMEGSGSNMSGIKCYNNRLSPASAALASNKARKSTIEAK